MNGLSYLLQTNLYLLVFMGFYVLVLRNETFFRQNRFFLNTSIFLSFAIPFINSDWFRDFFITQKVREAAIMPSQMIYETVIVGMNEDTSSVSLADTVFWIYTTGATALLIRFFIRLVFLKANLKAEKGTAFSFFRTMVVDKNIPMVDTIIDHEKVHMRQWHSADIIFVELAAIINWFNPVMYLYKKEIRHIHEFIADEEAATLMQSKADYALLLFSNTLGVDPLHLSNNFFNKSLLKRRIVMLHKERSRSTGLWKYGFSAPLFMLMLIVSAATVKSEEAVIMPVAETLLKPLDTGTSNSIMEALELNTPKSLVTKEPIATPAVTVPDNVTNSQASPDFTELRKHFMKNIKYPAAARVNNITGHVLANFVIKDKKISGVQIEKGLHSDVDEDVIRTFNLFTSEIDAPDDRYSIVINYTFFGEGTQVNELPNINAKNFIGHITVTAQKPNGKLKLEDFTPEKKTGKHIGLEEVVVSGDNAIKDFASVEVLPQFPGGMEGWSKNLMANLKYPKQARDEKITGRVFLSFIVEKDGSLSDIKVLRGIGGGADEEAVRVVKNSPKWIPGMMNGRAVRVAYTMPINFQLSGNQETDKRPGETKTEN